MGVTHYRLGLGALGTGMLALGLSYGVMYDRVHPLRDDYSLSSVTSAVATFDISSLVDQTSSYARDVTRGLGTLTLTGGGILFLYGALNLRPTVKDQ